MAADGSQNLLLVHVLKAADIFFDEPKMDIAEVILLPLVEDQLRNIDAFSINSG